MIELMMLEEKLGGQEKRGKLRKFIRKKVVIKQIKIVIKFVN